MKSKAMMSIIPFWETLIGADLYKRNWDNISYQLVTTNTASPHHGECTCTFEIPPQTLIPKWEVALFLESNQTNRLMSASVLISCLPSCPPRFHLDDGRLQLQELTNPIPSPVKVSYYLSYTPYCY